MATSVLYVELGIDATNGDLLDQMRIMKRAREERRYDSVVCTIRGFDGDARELFDIPEVRAFCRRAVNLGFTAYLDTSSGSLFGPPELVSIGWGHAEVWLCSEGRMRHRMAISVATAKEINEASHEANSKSDAAIGPFTT